MAEVQLKNVTKKFVNVTAVNDISLTVRDREFLTLVGPSGCGKSTTLRMIAGLEKLSAGQIYFNNAPVGHLAANQRDIAMVFQSYALYPHMDVAQNIGFALRMMGVPKSEVSQRVHEASKMLGIDHLLHRKPKELSGGQRQRVALGRSIVRNAGAYLLDEPLSNLDAKLRILMRAELKNLHSELQRTFIYVTHDQAEAMTMSDRIVVMNEGTIQQHGSPLEIYNRPTNRFVAGFIGSPPMNFIEGDLSRENGNLYFVADNVRQIVPAYLASSVDKYDQRSAVLGVRPEDVYLSHERAEGSQPATVFVVEPMGSDVLVTLNIAGTQVKVRADAEFQAKPHQDLFVQFRDDKLHLFAADDGRSLRIGQDGAETSTTTAAAD